MKTSIKSSKIGNSARSATYQLNKITIPTRLPVRKNIAFAKFAGMIGSRPTKIAKSLLRLRSMRNFGYIQQKVPKTLQVAQSASIWTNGTCVSSVHCVFAGAGSANSADLLSDIRCQMFLQLFPRLQNLKHLLDVDVLPSR